MKNKVKKYFKDTRSYLVEASLKYEILIAEGKLT
jgi:hypothetical protein